MHVYDRINLTKATSPLIFLRLHCTQRPPEYIFSHLYVVSLLVLAGVPAMYSPPLYLSYHQDIPKLDIFWPTDYDYFGIFQKKYSFLSYKKPVLGDRLVTRP